MSLSKAEYRIGVHSSHCCDIHGCKYGDDDCPVELKEVAADYKCEQCYWEEEEDMRNPRMQALKKQIARLTSELADLKNTNLKLFVDWDNAQEELASARETAFEAGWNAQIEFDSGGDTYDASWRRFIDTITRAVEVDTRSMDDNLIAQTEFECIHCGGFVSDADLAHWEQCEKHPARAAITALHAWQYFRDFLNGVDDGSMVEWHRAIRDTRIYSYRQGAEDARALLMQELEATKHSLQYWKHAGVYEAELKEQEKELRKNAEVELDKAKTMIKRLEFSNDCLWDEIILRGAELKEASAVVKAAMELNENPTSMPAFVKLYQALEPYVSGRSPNWIPDPARGPDYEIPVFKDEDAR